MNYSRQREIIHDTLKQNVVHPTAEYIHTVLKKNHPEIGIATVYRNLNKLAQSGEILKIEGLEGKSHFDHNTFEHHHFICMECGKVYDIMPEIAPEMIKKTEEQTGFKITRAEIAFQGICKECLEKHKNQ